MRKNYILAVAAGLAVIIILTVWVVYIRGEKSVVLADAYKESLAEQVADDIKTTAAENLESSYKNSAKDYGAEDEEIKKAADIVVNYWI